MRERTASLLAAFALLGSVAAHGQGPFARAAALARERCVKIFGAGRGREHGYATGLIVSPEGHILTAQGIYLSGARLRVVLHDGREAAARVLRRSERLQAALLKVNLPTPRFFALPDEPVVAPGDWVLAVSNAYKVAAGAEPLSVNLGVVSARAELAARHRRQELPYRGEVLLIDAITSNPGAQGGALVTADGRLAGMLGKLLISEETRTRLNYAVPADLLKPFVEGGDAPLAVERKAPADLGVRIFRLGGRRAPAYVDRVRPDSPAAKAGLRKDDMFITIGGQVVRSVRDYDRILEELAPGEEVVVRIKRGGRIIALRITPEEAP